MCPDRRRSSCRGLSPIVLVHRQTGVPVPVRFHESQMSDPIDQVGFMEVLDNHHAVPVDDRDRKSTRLNSSHSQISYAVFCLKKKKKKQKHTVLYNKVNSTSSSV